MNAKRRGFVCRRLSDELVMFEESAIRNRKLLRQFSQGKSRRTRVVVGDAIAIVEQIETLTRFARSCDAEDLVVIEFLLVDMSTSLEGALDEIFAS